MQCDISSELIQKCIDGDNSAWTTIVDRYISFAYKAIIIILNRHFYQYDNNDVEDICQNTFIKLFLNDYKVLRSYDRARSKFSTLLTVIARNAAIDYMRKFKEPATPISDIVDELYCGEIMDTGKIDIPTNVVSPRQHLVLRMLYDDGLDVEAVAKFLDVKRQTVRSLHHRAIKKLREHYRLDTDENASPSVSSIQS